MVTAVSPKLHPASTTISTPVTYELSPEAKNSAALWRGSRPVHKDLCQLQFQSASRLSTERLGGASTSTNSLSFSAVIVN
jgi:hypothetical protein